MLDYVEEYTKWMKHADYATKDELTGLDKKEIQDRFSKHLEFGTGGLRGVMGAGTNRMNAYVVARATQGLSNYIIKHSNGAEEPSVVIAYDSRNNSASFANKAAQVLSANGIKVYLFDELRPTPELSFAVRYKKAVAGIVITASHNPPEYNGYKVYWSDGAQISTDIAKEIYDEIMGIDVFDFRNSEKKELINIVGSDIDDEYIKNVYAQSVNGDVNKKDFSILYTPLHGSGYKLVKRILKRSGFENVFVVAEQELPNGDFPTVNSPNPENRDCFELAIRQAKDVDAELILATDPDCDRIGVAIKDNSGEYIVLSGNQVGVLLLDYILSFEQASNPAAVTTIVSTRMAEKVCAKYNVKLFRTLTGFKYIGEKIKEFKTSGDFEFVFGFEESCGYLKGTYARDKDAVVASMLVAEMAVYYSEKGITLYDAMQNLYDKFGGYYEELESISFSGLEGTKKIESIMSRFRDGTIIKIGKFAVNYCIDYLGSTMLPKSDVLYFSLDNNVHFIVRPSGTEPKIKCYYLAEGKNFEHAKRSAIEVKNEVDKIFARL